MKEKSPLKKFLLQSVVVLSVLALSLGFIACTDRQEVTSGEEQEQLFRYQHDPRDNPYAMADIEADEKAIYGF